MLAATFWSVRLFAGIMGIHFVWLGSVPAVFVLAVYGVLTLRWGPKASDNETRCRKCDYILRGITEPRCPECGEVI